MKGWCTIESPVGTLTVTGCDEAVTGLWLEGQKYFGSTMEPGMTPVELPVFDQLRAWLAQYFAGGKPEFLPPLQPEGTPFRQAIWQKMLEIPYGQTTTYRELTKSMNAQSDHPTSARAVGGAVGHNPISILIPCHRVVGADGSLTGYAGGLERKIQLLRLEGAALEPLQG